MWRLGREVGLVEGRGRRVVCLGGGGKLLEKGLNCVVVVAVVEKMGFEGDMVTGRADDNGSP